MVAKGIGRELGKNMRQLHRIPPGSGKEEGLPIILGRDFSGVVEKVGSKVTSVKVGDEVWAALPFYYRGGALADYIVMKDADLCRKPRGITHDMAASFPCVATYIWCSLFLTAIIGSKRTKQQRILITGGTGGIGTFAIQLMKAWGGYVTATCQDESGVKLLKSLGADEAVNIAQVELETSQLNKPKFDVVIDTVGPSARKACFKLCVKGGHYVSFVTPVMEDADKYGMMAGSFVSNVSKMKLAFLHSCTFSWGFTLPDGKILEKIVKYIESKKIRPVIDRTYSIEDAMEGIRHVSSGRTMGKTVITFN